MSLVDEKQQPEVIFDWCLQANARFQLPLAPVFGVPGGWSPTRTLHPFWGNFRVAVIRTRSLDPHNQARGQTGLRHLGRLAEFECELISERTKVGLIFVRARSRKGGDRYKMTAAKLRLAMASMGKTADHGRQPMP